MADQVSLMHDRVFKTLRSRIMYGEIEPGAVLTLRGIAKDFETSMMPARDAVRRLSAEGALTMSASGRLSTPAPGNDRIEELAALRALIEPELAIRALPRAHSALIDRLAAINGSLGAIVANGDAVGYIRNNLEFHRTLYLRAQAPAMLATVENVWLQLGPTMRKLYSRMRQNDLPQHHLTILAALRAGDEAGLRQAVRTDVTQGLRMLIV
jgi:DNA-binding GntR family transcriptional regulator